MFLEDSLFNYVDLACFWEEWGRCEEGDFCVFITLRGADLRDCWCMRLLGSQAGLCLKPCLHSGHAARTCCSHLGIQWFCRWRTKQKEAFWVFFCLNSRSLLMAQSRSAFIRFSVALWMYSARVKGQVWLSLTFNCFCIVLQKQFFRWIGSNVGLIVSLMEIT